VRDVHHRIGIRIAKTALADIRNDPDDRGPRCRLSGRRIIGQTNPRADWIGGTEMQRGGPLIDDRHFVARTAVIGVEGPPPYEAYIERVEVPRTGADHRHVCRHVAVSGRSPIHGKLANGAAG
jgi:hypothetical protein